MITIDTLANYISYFLVFIGILSFLTAVIVQVIKELPGLNSIPTSLVAFFTSLIISVLFVAAIGYLKGLSFQWFFIPVPVVIAFIVYLIATGGWERIHAIWERTKYDKK